MVIYRKALNFFLKRLGNVSLFSEWYLVLLVFLVHLSGLFKERDVSLCDG